MQDPRLAGKYGPGATVDPTDAKKRLESYYKTLRAISQGPALIMKLTPEQRRLMYAEALGTDEAWPGSLCAPSCLPDEVSGTDAPERSPGDERVDNDPTDDPGKGDPGKGSTPISAK